jgi:MarR family transcriptional regulator, 2-MHQ and catechol-resistance regulon repressor
MGTHYKGSAEKVQALNVFIKLIRASESVMSRLARHLSEHDLTAGQFGTLEALLHLGPMCQAELGRKQLRSSGNITMVVDHLEKRGFVSRKREGGDRRYITVHLTPRGRKLIADVFPRHLDAIVREMDVLSSTEQKQIEKLLRKIGLQESSHSQIKN